MKMVLQDTIAAIATPLGTSGIGVVRMSGPTALEIAGKAFISGRAAERKKALPDYQSHSIHYGKIVSETGELIDEVLLLVMKGPATFTGEDTVEIDCHGGVYILTQVLQRLIACGARMAEPGEFTKRAFLNGKVDLSQAEAIMDMISARTSQSHAAASKRLEGKLSQKIEQMRQQLMDLMVLLEVEIDYPEYEIEEAQMLDEENTLHQLKDALTTLYKTADTGRMLNEGVRIVLCGRPNMGKSTLLNALLGEDRAIVTEIPGTTRDTLEENVNLDGIPVRLIDTAGLHDTPDRIEQMGVERSYQAMDSADLILFLIDAGTVPTAEDLEILQKASVHPCLIVQTKMDQQKTQQPTGLAYPAVTISAKTGEGMDSLKQYITEFVMSGAAAASDGVFLANVRQKQAIHEALDAIETALSIENEGLGSDMVSLEVRRAYDALGELTGNSASDELVDTIFSRFCLGK